MSIEFREFWNGRFAGIPPVGYVLRNALHDRWLRFHSLPDSKRYAESEDEYSELLMRANTVATEVLGAGEPCWLVMSTCDEAGATRDDHVVLGSHRLAQSFLWRDYDEDEVDWMAYATGGTWSAGAYDDLIREIADEGLFSVIWVSSGNGTVFAPYDGGMDLILPSADVVRQLKARHSSWLSRHPKGL